MRKTKAEELLKIMEVGPQLRTRVKNEMPNAGSRNIRNTVETAQKKIKDMLNPDNDAPNPADDRSQQLLSECLEELEITRGKLREVKDSRRRRNG